MADSIFQGLFGPTPYAIQNQQNAGLNDFAYKAAQMNAGQRGAMALMQGGGMLAGAGADAMGWQNPAVADAKRKEEILGQANVQTPEGLLAAAEQARMRGDVRLQMQLQMLAQQKRTEQQKSMMDSVEYKLKLKKLEEEASAFTKPNIKDFKPDSIRKYAVSKDPADLEPINEDGKTSQDYLRLKEAGYSEEEIKAEMRRLHEAEIYSKRKATGTSVNIDQKQETEFEKELGRKQAGALIESKSVAEDAASIMETAQIGKSLLNKGVITGFGSNFLTSFGSALNSAGITLATDAVANTQAYSAAMAQNVAKIIKQFGAGTGLSDADREYAQKMAGGDISLTEQSLRKIINISEKLATNTISRHNKKAAGIKTNIPLTVDLPVVPADTASKVSQIPTQTTPPQGKVRKYNPVTGRIE